MYRILADGRGLQQVWNGQSIGLDIPDREGNPGVLRGDRAEAERSRMIADPLIRQALGDVAHAKSLIRDIQSAGIAGIPKRRSRVAEAERVLGEAYSRTSTATGMHSYSASTHLTSYVYFRALDLNTWKPRKLAVAAEDAHQKLTFAEEVLRLRSQFTSVDQVREGYLQLARTPREELTRVDIARAAMLASEFSAYLTTPEGLSRAFSNGAALSYTAAFGRGGDAFTVHPKVWEEFLSLPLSANDGDSLIANVDRLDDLINTLGPNQMSLAQMRMLLRHIRSQADEIAAAHEASNQSVEYLARDISARAAQGVIRTEDVERLTPGYMTFPDFGNLGELIASARMLTSMLADDSAVSTRSVAW
jgi:hypothetical protein